MTRRGVLCWGPLSLVLSAMVMLTSLFGASAEGATRWVSVGGLSVQSSFLVVPIVAMVFARQQGLMTSLAIVLAALALAIQPDRGMSGALAAGMLVLAFAKPTKFSAIAASVAIFGFVITLLQSDTLPATQYVDQIYFSSFGVHPLAGLAVLVGAFLLVAPAFIGRLCGGVLDANTYLVFGAVWGGIGIAAALGNYPTPIVGYGGSAIIGYVICMLGFSKPLKRDTGVGKTRARSDVPFDYTSDLRVILT
jgi:hypothetical protein